MEDAPLNEQQIIAELREEDGKWGWQTELSKRLKVSQPYLSQVIKGLRRPNAQIISEAGFDPTPYYYRRRKRR